MKITRFLSLLPGDRVTIRTPQGQEVTGRAQQLLCNPSREGGGTVVLNMGGAHGTPAVCTEDNFVRATRPNPAHLGKRRTASRSEQHARYIDCGPQAWDDQ